MSSLPVRAATIASSSVAVWYSSERCSKRSRKASERWPVAMYSTGF